MATTLAIIHIIVCVFLILLIMIQDPKGGGSGLFSGGGSNSLLGSSGGADFLTKATRYMAIAFGVLCITLTLFTRPTKTGVFSDTKNLPIQAPAEAATDKVNPTEPPATTPTNPVTPSADSEKK
jgi:preprotein translocase subunit SecG